MKEWRLADTAPQETWVLVVYKSGEMGGDVSIAMLYKNGTWTDWDGDLYGEITHWMPLPNPPENMG